MESLKRQCKPPGQCKAADDIGTAYHYPITTRRQEPNAYDA